MLFSIKPGIIWKKKKKSKKKTSLWKSKFWELYLECKQKQAWFHVLSIHSLWIKFESGKFESGKFSLIELSWVELSRVLADRLFVSELDKLMWVTVEHSVSAFNAQTQTGIHLRCYSTANISTKVVWNWDKFNQQQAKPKSSFHIFIWIIE